MEQLFEVVGRVLVAACVLDIEDINVKMINHPDEM